MNSLTVNEIQQAFIAFIINIICLVMIGVVDELTWQMGTNIFFSDTLNGRSEIQIN